jgi:putative ABC transport system permease protein
MRALFDNCRLAAGTLWANPLRSLLTLLGIVIGVATVVCMMGLIEGLRLKVNRDLSQLGADAFQVQKWPVGFGRFDWQKYSKRPNFTLADREAILANCPSVLAVAAEESEGGQKLATSTHETQPSVMVSAGTPEWIQTNGWSIASGRSFGEAEQLDARPVAVVGLDVSDRLFPGMDPLDQTLRIKGRQFSVIGVLQRRGSFLGMGSQDNRVMIPLSAFEAIYGSNRSMRLSIQAKDATLVSKAQDEVVSLLRRRRHLSPTAENNFEVFNNDSATKTFNELSQMITAASFGVCLLSLVVGGIGILNIMLFSVTERTREIGVRKALGAKRRRILAQFATEAVALSLVGGVLGIAIGFSLAFLSRWVLDFPTVVPAWAVGLSLLMSSGVGLLFGIYPAARAARLDPVEAMRAE